MGGLGALERKRDQDGEIRREEEETRGGLGIWSHTASPGLFYLSSHSALPSACKTNKSSQSSVNPTFTHTLKGELNPEILKLNSLPTVKLLNQTPHPLPLPHLQHLNSLYVHSGDAWGGSVS